MEKAVALAEMPVAGPADCNVQKITLAKAFVYALVACRFCLSA
jgi:hypothetical protein